MPSEVPDVRFSELKIDRTRRAQVRRVRRLAWALPILALLLVVGVLLARRPTSVAVAQVREARPGEAATELSAAGYVAARRRSTVAPKYAGRLDRVLVEEGERVEQGQVLARMDDSDAAVAVAQAEAAVSAARANIAANHAGAIRAGADLVRARRLFAGTAINRQQLQEAVAVAEAARANEDAAVARLDEAYQALQAARLRLDNTVVRAPFAATIARKLADEGAVLAPAAITEPNMGAIVEIVDLSSLDVEAEVSEEQLARIHEGQPALIFLDAYPERVFRALTRTVRPSIDRSKATAVVKVDFDEEPKGALPNMGAKVSFLKENLSADTLRHEARLRVPAASVVQRQGRAVVLIVSGGRIREEPVEVERQVGQEKTLKAGPKPGTQVVALPSPRLRDGRRVRIRAEGS